MHAPGTAGPVGLTGAAALSALAIAESDRAARFDGTGARRCCRSLDPPPNLKRFYKDLQLPSRVFCSEQ